MQKWISSRPILEEGLKARQDRGNEDGESEQSGR
jgi:hypothetical protein